jgi:hypothetical protein
MVGDPDERFSRQLAAAPATVERCTDQKLDANVSEMPTFAQSFCHRLVLW